MDGVEAQDPFLWDVDTVARKLSTPGWPWGRDPSTLVAHVQEEELDGKTLLTYDHIFSRKELMECLGIKPARHKAALAEAIVGFRSRSRAYQQWLQLYSRQESGYVDDEPKEPAQGMVGLNSILALPNGDHQVSPSGSFSVGINGEQAPKAFAQADTASRLDTFENSAQKGPSNEAQPSPQLDGQLVARAHIDPPATVETTASTRENADDDRSVKRRRIVPTLLDSKPHNIAPSFLPSAADVLDYSVKPDSDSKSESEFALEQAGAHRFPWERAPPYAYLGKGRISTADIKDSTVPLSSNLLEFEDGAFATTTATKPPPGLRNVVSRVLRHVMVSNSREPALLSRSSSPESQGSNHSDPVLHWSDMDEDFDEETWNEIEAEALENEQAENSQSLPTLISNERVREILDEAIQSMEATWREAKLPKHERTAYRLWINARRMGTKNHQVRHAHIQAKHSNDKIEEFCTEIVKEQWKKEARIRDQAVILQQTIENKAYHVWLMGVLESSRPPPKPSRVPRPRQVAVQQTEVPLGEEILTSSDEDDFIVPDEELKPEDHPMGMEEEAVPAGPGSRPESLKAESPVTPDYMDLTQDLSAAATPGGHAFGEADVIDLTILSESEVSRPPSPQKNTQVPPTPPPPSPPPPPLPKETVLPSSVINVPPPIETLGNIQTIGGVSPKRWVKKSDRWRLLICLIWRLDHSRRRGILDRIQSTQPDVIWTEHFESYMADPVRSKDELTPENSKTVSFDFVRLFHCFFQCQNVAEDSVIKFKRKKLNKRLRKTRGVWFNPFCKFIEMVLPEFPQDSQIYRNDDLDALDAEELDDDLGDDLDNDEDVESMANRKARKNRPEIIRDRAAVDLREREHQRLEEQEARRNKLRMDLKIHGVASDDKARIIINESKEEDQSLIYINEAIGPRIKEHQIDGVRFLWNQIVRDPETRQGCLLAHTMGLGKTMQVITFLVALADSSKSKDPSVVAQIPEDLRKGWTLVLCPPSLVDNWIDEFLIWAPKGLLGKLRKLTATLKGDDRSDTVEAWASEGGVLVIGYNMFKILLEIPGVSELLVEKPSIVITDEAHALKNPETKTHMACSRFNTNARIALTGTPLHNSVLEYYAMINWVAPNFLGPLAEFKIIYSLPVEQGFDFDSGPIEKRRALTKLAALKKLVAPKVHRRTTAALKDGLPPKYEFVIYVPPGDVQKKLYVLYQEGIKGQLGDAKASVLSAMNNLSLICRHPRCFQEKITRVREGDRQREGGIPTKHSEDVAFPRQIIPQALQVLNVPDINDISLSRKTELLTVILDEARKVGDKVLVFSQSLDSLNYLEAMCKMQLRTISRLDGSTAVESRQEEIKRFNEGSKEVYLISTTAGGVGLNIHGANRVVIFDIKWNPTVEQQGIGRAYRLGQKKPVFVYWLTTAGTFEQIIHNQHVFKQQLAARVVDKKNPISWSKRKGSVLAPLNENMKPADLSPSLGKDVILDKLINYRKNGKAILSIVETVLFEREDVDTTLTAEEQKRADELVEMNNLRSTDPERYEQVKLQIDRGDLNQQVSAMAAASMVNQRPVHRSFDGASDLPDEGNGPIHMAAGLYGWTLDGANESAVGGNTTVVRPPTPPPPHVQGPIPMPMPGANTFFGEHPPQVPVAENQRPAPPQPFVTTPTAPPTPVVAPTPMAAPTPTATPKEPLQSSPRPAPHSSIFKGGGLFNVSEIPAKVEFEKQLQDTVRKLQQRNVPRMGGDAAQIASALTDRVNTVRKEGKFGFLPDTQRWKFLVGLLSHDKFGIAIVAGYLSADYVALAEEHELESRMQTINALEEMDISAQADRRFNSPDPNNLQNIRRHSLQRSETRPLVRDDMKVMREAMDNRKNRASRLPQWANQALEEEKNRGSPRPEPLERRTVSRNGTPRGGQVDPWRGA
ncbi:hypothetical protein NW754_006184 [Fusarium falciforme]|nr:hypothetical protein NW754_006184 [Fusarium falciforme]